MQLSIFSFFVRLFTWFTRLRPLFPSCCDSFSLPYILDLEADESQTVCLMARVEEETFDMLDRMRRSLKLKSGFKPYLPSTVKEEFKSLAETMFHELDVCLTGQKYSGLYFRFVCVDRNRIKRGKRKVGGVKYYIFYVFATHSTVKECVCVVLTLTSTFSDDSASVGCVSSV